MRERTKSFWKAFLGAAVALTLVFSVAAPASADTTGGSGGGGGAATASGSSSWYWAYGDRPGDAWNAFVADWGSGVRAQNGTVYSYAGIATGVDLSICQNAAQIWWVHFNATGLQKFWGKSPNYLIRDDNGVGHAPDWWIRNLGPTGAAQEARGWVAGGTVLGNGQYTVPAGGQWFTDAVRASASTWVANSGINNMHMVVVCSYLSPALAVDESGTQTRTITNGATYNSPSSFTTAVQRQVLNTTSATATDNGVDLVGVNNLHDQAASPVITNYGNVLRGITNGTLFGSTPMNNLSRAQWNQIDTLIANARNQDATLQHGAVELSTANKAGLAEGGVLNVSEWAQRATITTSGSQTYTDYWRYTGVRYWQSGGWGPVQNINWLDTRLSTVPTWNTPNGWTLASEHYSVTSATPTQENTGFWQILSVHCNLDELNALKSALTAAGRSATTIQQTNNDDGTISAILRTPVTNQGWADVPVSNAAQQSAVNAAQASLTAAQTAHSNAVTAYNAAVNAAATAQATFNSAQTEYQNRNNNAGPSRVTLDTANVNLATAQDNYNTARTAALSASSALHTAIAAMPSGSSSGYGSSTITLPASVTSVMGNIISEPVTDSNGNVWLKSANYIVSVSPTGVVGTPRAIPSSGTATAIDSLNRIYTLTAAGTGLFRFDPATNLVTTLPMSGSVPLAGGLAVDAQFNVFATDYWQNSVVRITPAGALTTVAYYDMPWGVAVDNTYVYAATANGIERTPKGGGTTTLLPAINNPSYVTISNGIVYALSQNMELFRLNAAQTAWTAVMATSTVQVAVPGSSGFGVSASDGAIYYGVGNSLRKFTPTGGLSVADQTAATSALTTYENNYRNIVSNSVETNYVANPSTASTNAVTRVNAVVTSSSTTTLINLRNAFTTANSNLATAWTAYNSAFSSQQAAQTAFNNANAGVAAYLLAMQNAAVALENANNAVDTAASLVTTRAEAVTNAQNSLAAANAALTDANGVTQRVWAPARPSILDFGDARNTSSALAASGYVGFYDKECVTNCTTAPTGPNATAANGANGNASNTANLGHKDSLGGAVLRDAQAREEGNTSPSTNSNYLEVFRDNSQSRTVRVNTAYPVVAGTNFNYNGGAAFTTTVNIWGMSTPDTNPAAGQFFMTATNITNRTGGGTTEVLFDGLNGTNIWTTDLTRAPGTQKNFGNDLYSTGISETFSGFSNTFRVSGTWASEVDRPVVLNIKWEYRPTTVVTVPALVGFNTVATGTDNASQLRISRTEDLNQALDVRCYAQYGSSNSLDNNLSDLTQQYTGTGSVNNIDTGLIGTANGDDSYLEPNNLVIKFIRGVSE